MQRVSTVLTAAAAALLSTTASAAPDRIYLSDGSIVEDVKVKSQTFTSVTYEPAKGRGESQVDSELVLRVEFDNKPAEISTAEVEAESENYVSAVSGLQNYLQNLGDKADRKAPWGPPYARYRIAELMRLGGDVPSMIGAVDELLAKHPDSRYVPLALVDKIEAQMAIGDLAGAKATSDKFGEMVRSKSMPARWEHEQALRDTLTKGLKGEALEKELAVVSRAGAAFPTVENRADVAIADSLVLRNQLDKAEALYRGVVEDPSAYDGTLAAAWTGLAELIFNRGEAVRQSKGDDNAEAKALFEEARMCAMRVVVVYRTEYSFVAKSGFYAGRCFQLIGGPDAVDRSSRLYRFIVRNFPETRWAQNAREYQRLNR